MASESRHVVLAQRGAVPGGLADVAGRLAGPAGGEIHTLGDCSSFRAPPLCHKGLGFRVYKYIGLNTTLTDIATTTTIVGLRD